MSPNDQKHLDRGRSGSKTRAGRYHSSPPVQNHGRSCRNTHQSPRTDAPNVIPQDTPETLLQLRHHQSAPPRAASPSVLPVQEVFRTYIANLSHATTAVLTDLETQLNDSHKLVSALQSSNSTLVKQVEALQLRCERQAKELRALNRKLAGQEHSMGNQKLLPTGEQDLNMSQMFAMAPMSMDSPAPMMWTPFGIESFGFQNLPPVPGMSMPDNSQQQQQWGLGVGQTLGPSHGGGIHHGTEEGNAARIKKRRTN